MKVLFDENFPANAKFYMKKMFPHHQYVQSGMGKEFPSMDDSDLFRAAAADNVNMVITSDIRQVEGPDRRNERKACREAGLHWVGIPHPLNMGGREGVRSQIAMLLATFSYIEKYLLEASEPRAILFQRSSGKPPLAAGYPQPL